MTYSLENSLKYFKMMQKDKSLPIAARVAAQKAECAILEIQVAIMSMEVTDENS